MQTVFYNFLSASNLAAISSYENLLLFDGDGGVLSLVLLLLLLLLLLFLLLSTLSRSVLFLLPVKDEKNPDADRFVFFDETLAPQLPQTLLLLPVAVDSDGDVGGGTAATDDG